MAKKEITTVLKLQIQAGKANPSPPVGPALGQAGVNIMDFCNAFNEATKKLEGPIPVLITVYKDRSFTFVTKLAPMSYMIKTALKMKRGSRLPGKEMMGRISDKQVTEIARAKMPDLNANDINAAKKIVAGTAVSMGLEVEELKEVVEA